jgi:hypothetical protein
MQGSQMRDKMKVLSVIWGYKSQNTEEKEFYCDLKENCRREKWLKNLNIFFLEVTQDCLNTKYVFSNLKFDCCI